MGTHSNNSKVAIVSDIGLYPVNFYPDQLYAEFKKTELFAELNPNNQVFRSIRKLLIQLEFDKENIDTLNWNPLSDIIKPGNTVLLKPNLVKHESNRKETTYTNKISWRPKFPNNITYMNQIKQFHF